MNESEQYYNQMVRIDGDRVKGLREKQGLTQLYMATAVGVTIETISRWENRRYPSIKRENAEKLAEVLGVDLGEIIDAQEEEGERVSEEPTPPVQPPVKPTLPPRLKRHLSVIVMVFLVLAVLQAVRYFAGTSRPAVKVFAERVLPAHVPAGQVLPILIRVKSSEPVSFSLLLKENLPPGCEPLTALPEFTSVDKETTQVKWVSRLEGDHKLFVYLVKTPPVPEESELIFSGRLLAGPMTGASPEIGGDSRLRIADFHWADRNRDYRIDDEEILMVYDLFGNMEKLDLDRELVDEIWAAGGYGWNEETGNYVVAP